MASSNPKPGSGTSSSKPTTATTPSRLQFQCTYEILNTLAVAVGQNGRAQRACKGVLFIKRLQDGTFGISISKNKESQSFVSTNIKTIRKNFIADGKLTIEFRAPPINLMLRDASVGNLNNLLEMLGMGGSNGVGAAALTPGPAKVPAPGSENKSGSSGPTAGAGAEAKPRSGRSTPVLAPVVQNSDSGTSKGMDPRDSSAERKYLSPKYRMSKHDPDSFLTPKELKLKRRDEMQKDKYLPKPKISDDQRSGVLMMDFPGCFEVQDPNNPARRMPYFRELTLKRSREEEQDIRRLLRENTKKLTITDRRNLPGYNQSYPNSLIELQILNIGLVKIDLRILSLQNLKMLNLAENGLKCVELLKKLQSPLHRLDLRGNRISRLSEDFFLCRAMKGLFHLDLDGNQLECLPRSIVHLTDLRYLWVNRNLLKFLPYNMHLMENLCKLYVSKNYLPFLPYPLLRLRLIEFDMSDNPMNAIGARVGIKIDKVGDGFPSLFELTVSKIATHNWQKRRTPTELIKASYNEIPPFLSDCVEATKACCHCWKLVFRYRLITQRMGHQFPTHTTLTGLTSVMEFPVKKIICDNCYRE